MTPERVEASTIDLKPYAPLAPVAAAPWIPDERDQIQPGDTVLLAIEDDPAFARILVDLIRRKGHRALAADAGESGLELVRRYRPTGAQLDVLLPRTDGWAVIERMKVDAETLAMRTHERDRPCRHAGVRYAP